MPPESKGVESARQAVEAWKATVARRKEQIESKTYPVDSGDLEYDEACTGDWLRRDEAELANAVKELQMAQRGRFGEKADE